MTRPLLAPLLPKIMPGHPPDTAAIGTMNDAEPNPMTGATTLVRRRDCASIDSMTTQE